MHVLVICKTEEDPIKNESARVSTTFHQLKVNRFIQDVQGQLTKPPV